MANPKFVEISESDRSTGTWNNYSVRKRVYVKEIRDFALKAALLGSNYVASRT